MTTTANIALLIFRLAVGLTLMAHGSQKAFGLFGGLGLVKQRQSFEQQGYKPSWFWVALAVIGELGGGLSVVFGFLTPFGAAGILGAMVMAVKTRWKDGFFTQHNGYEYPLMLSFAGLFIGLIGPGSYSLDALFGISLPVYVFIVLAVLALLVDVIGIVIVSRKTPALQPGSAS